MNQRHAVKSIMTSNNDINIRRQKYLLNDFGFDVVSTPVSMSFEHRFRCRFDIGFDVVSTSVSTSFRHRFRRRSTVKITVYLRLIRRGADVGSTSIVLVIEDVTTLYRPHFSVGLDYLFRFENIVKF